jgi:Aldehyde dehydrogenase family
MAFQVVCASECFAQVRLVVLIVLIDAASANGSSCTEIFGLVAAIQAFADADDVVALANDTPWGLVGYVVTQDLDRALNVSEELEVGMVGLNAGIVSDPATPFGGVDIWAGPGRQSPRHRRVPRIQVDQHADSTVSLPSVRCTTDAMPTGVNRALVTRSVSRR